MLITNQHQQPSLYPIKHDPHHVRQKLFIINIPYKLYTSTLENGQKRYTNYVQIYATGRSNNICIFLLSLESIE